MREIRQSGSEGGGAPITLSLPLSGAVSIFRSPNNVLALQIGSLSTASMRHTLSDFTVNGPYFTGGFEW